jgi:hypothetical protein
VPGPRVSAQTHRCPKFGPRMGVSSPPDMFGSARWALFFRPLCPVGQKRTRGVRLGRPAGDALREGARSMQGNLWHFGIARIGAAPGAPRASGGGARSTQGKWRRCLEHPGDATRDYLLGRRDLGEAAVAIGVKNAWGASSSGGAGGFRQPGGWAARRSARSVSSRPCCRRCTSEAIRSRDAPGARSSSARGPGPVTRRGQGRRDWAVWGGGTLGTRAASMRGTAAVGTRSAGGEELRWGGGVAGS